MVGFNFAPEGWALCNGQTLAISDNDALFNLIGTTYGGNGQTTFMLPNLQSRLPVHMGTGGGGTYVLGQLAGEEQVTLTTSQLPSHSHLPMANSSSGTQPAPANNVWAASSALPYSNHAPDAVMAAQAVQNAGGGQPHDNLPPYLAVNFIISLYGVYPSQN
jgi:microcystin-dependent protein